jgi:hypothetical protein
MARHGMALRNTAQLEIGTKMGGDRNSIVSLYV